MNEDRKRNRKDNGPENIGILRRLALNLARLEGSNGSVKGKLKRAGWNDESSGVFSGSSLNSICDSPGLSRTK